MNTAGSRPPAVAGSFYPADPGRLRDAIEWCYLHDFGPGVEPTPATGRLRGWVGFVVPHAGLAYSGPIAAHAYAAATALGCPDVAVVLGPNHSSAGAPLAVSPWQTWDTPLGAMRVDSKLGEALRCRVRGLWPDAAGHRREHSIEVQLPFLAHVFGTDMPILPVAVTDPGLETARELGDVLVEALGDRNTLIVASTDLSHYLPDERARCADRAATDAICTLDPVTVAKAAASGPASLCGAGPVMAMLQAARRVGITGARLLAYGTSGDTSGDRRQVVGYAAIQLGPALPPAH